MEKEAWLPKEAKLPQEAFLQRIRNTQEEMKRRGVDLFLVSPSSNLRYLTGYRVRGDERLLLLALPAEAPPALIANLLYQAQTAEIPAADFFFWADGEDPFTRLKEEVEKRGLPRRRIALEPQMPAAFSIPLARTFPDSEFILGAALTAKLRQRKSPEELALIRRACAEADRALAVLIDQALLGGGSPWVGRPEREFAEALFAEMRRGGVEDCEAIVAVGANAAVPHHVTGDTLIERGRGLLIDFGGTIGGYYTDSTRTFHFGPPSAEFEKVYAVVLEAHLAAEARARVGNTLGDVDAAARGVIEKHGYGEYFTHRTGHGLGIDEHEGASASPGETTPIEPGMVFSIEPGIYLPGRLGVRIENLVAIGEDGPEILHHYPRELRIIS
jgi:Xaa-Pro dipeptidase